MEFRDLKKQYKVLKSEIDKAIQNVLDNSEFISGRCVGELEESLADYVGTKYCITCGNGTDALQISLMALGVTERDAVFVPDFTFFASGEAPALLGAASVFVDVREDTFNIDCEKLEISIERIIKETDLTPKVIVAVDLFGQPAEYGKIRRIADKYNLRILEDGAQGFGGSIGNQKSCSFGDISTTSFFPAKPLGCYGDGGAIFTDDEEWAKIIRSICIHGKGDNKYDNVRLGMNSRLDTIQAAILQVKLEKFKEYELTRVNELADIYEKELSSYVETPVVLENCKSAWAQYTIKLENEEKRNKTQRVLKEQEIPSAVYYQKPMHEQTAFQNGGCICYDAEVTRKLCNRVLSIPIHPYMKQEEQNKIVKAIIKS